MKRNREGFGFLTMAWDAASLRRADGLAASLRLREPGVPIGLLTLTETGTSRWGFDVVVRLPQPEPFSFPFRFYNKLLALASHSPFERTMFLDDDVLVIRPILQTIERHFAGRPVAMNCDIRSPGETFPGTNHLDPGSVARAFGVERIFDPYGGGHLYYEKPACFEIFREALAEALFERDAYRTLTGDGFVSDELALAIVANRRGLAMPCLSAWIDPLDRANGEGIDLDITSGHYRFPQRRRGTDEGTELLHFFGNGKDATPYRAALATLVGPPDSGAEASRRTTGLLRRMIDRVLSQ